MNIRYLFIVFCATALFARIPTADAYTAIAVASSSSNGRGECCGYRFWNPQAAGQNGFLGRPGDLSHSSIEHLALNYCRRGGGINPKIVLATGKPGFFAIAAGVRKGKGSCIGWSGPLPSPEAAVQEAIAKCKEHGEQRWADTTWFVYPKIGWQWHDYYHAGEKRVSH